MAKQTYHVVSKIGGGWSLRKEGSDRASGTYRSKNEAVEHGRKVARKQGTDLVIHGRDGTITESATYGRGDPNPPGDKQR